MAWGLFKKILEGVKKAGRAVGRWFRRDAPALVNAAQVAGPIVGMVNPGLGAAIGAGAHIANAVVRGVNQAQDDNVWGGARR